YPPLARLPHGDSIVRRDSIRRWRGVVGIGQRCEPPTLRIDVENGQPAESIVPRIEVLVVIKIALANDDPLPFQHIEGLRGETAYDMSQGFGPPIRVGKNTFLELEKDAAEDNRKHDQRQ